LSHEHQDHAKSAKDITKAGIELYTSAGTAGKIGVTGHRLNVIESLKQVKINEWSVLPFGVEHDAAEPLGFLIVSGKEKILFITDTAYCQYRFKGLTHIMIEANFDDDILDNNIKAGVVEHSRRKRLLESHMSIKRVKDFLLASDLSKLQEIWLLHLSSANSDEVQFKLDVQRLAGVPVFVA
jgi:phosphoribosyl 1,2-cyclic phosphodiesterase